MLLPFPIYALCVFDWVFAVYVNCSSSSFLAFCPPTLRLYNIVQHQRLQIYVFNRVWKKDYWILFFLYQKKNFNLQRSKNRNLIPNIQKTKKLLFTLCYLKKNQSLLHTVCIRYKNGFRSRSRLCIWNCIFFLKKQTCDPVYRSPPKKNVEFNKL